MAPDTDPSYVERLRSIRVRYDLPPEMDDHLQDIIAQSPDAQTPAANANMTATRIQRFLTYLMEDYRGDYDDAQAVRDELADIYGSIVEDE